MDSQLCNAAFQDICRLTQDFLATLDSLSRSMIADVETAAPQKSVALLQQQFQQIIATVETARLDLQIEQRVRPFLTEGHRRLRLAGIEAMRLRTAKQPATIDKQRSLIQAHLDQLQKFAQAIADEVCSEVYQNP